MRLSLFLILFASFFLTESYGKKVVNYILLPRLAAPTNIRYTFLTRGLQLEWDHARADEDDISFVVRYRKYVDPEILVSDPSSHHWALVRTPTRAAFIGNVQEGRTYEIQVRAELSSINNATTESNWSPLLLIQIKSPSEPLLPTALKAPTHFTAYVSSLNSLAMHWTPGDPNQSPDTHYEVTVEQRTGANADRPKQKIMIRATSFTLNRLEPGANYRLTIKAVSDLGDKSPSRDLIVQLPDEEQYFSIDDLTLRTNPSAKPGTVNLTWHVPTAAQSHIQSYELRYSVENTEDWKRKIKTGTKPYATLVDLESDRVYLVQILTTLNTGVVLQSRTFQFLTPPVEPIQKVDVIYSRELDSVRLEWILQSHVEEHKISGYDVLVTQNKQRPETEWERISVDSTNKAVTLRQLSPASTYYAKIVVKNSDGSLLRGLSVYRFQTLDQQRANVQQPIALTYRNLPADSNGKAMVKIRWTLPDHVKASNLSAILVMYSANKTLPEQQWMKILVADTTRDSLTLTGLEPDHQYFLRIMPRYKNGKYMDPGAKNETSEAVVNESFSHQDQVDSSQRTEQLCIRSCKPVSKNLSQLCARGETCVPMTSGASSGWCVSDVLIESVKSLP